MAFSKRTLAIIVVIVLIAMFFTMWKQKNKNAVACVKTSMTDSLTASAVYQLPPDHDSLEIQFDAHHYPSSLRVVCGSTTLQMDHMLQESLANKTIGQQRIARLPEDARVTCRFTPYGTCVLIHQHIIYNSHSKAYLDAGEIMITSANGYESITNVCLQTYRRQPLLV